MPGSSRLLVAFATAALVAGCTLLGDFSTSRCSASGDCEALGLHGYVCAASNCEPPSSTVTSADAGDLDTQPSCTSNDECTRRAGDVPSVCARGTCVAAKIAGVCPIILGEEYFRRPETIVFGAFVESQPESALGTYNIDLALDEINLAGGVPSAAGARHFSVLVCSKATPDLVQQGATHLIDELALPAVIGQLETDELKDVAPKAAKTDTFVLSTLGNDATLRNTLAGAPVWFATGDLLDTAPAFGPLLSAVESYVDTTRSKTTIKVAMVASQSYETHALAAVLDDPVSPVLRFNGKTPSEQSGATGNYLRTDDIPSKYRSDKPDYTKVIGQLTAFQPDVVVGIAGDELVQNVIPGVEAAWGANPNRPYWVAASLSRYNVQIYDQTRPEPPKTLRSRFVGVDFSGSVDDLVAYDLRLAAHRDNLLASRAREGFNALYDATYVVALATMAAGTDSPPRGAKLGSALARIDDPNGMVIHAGTTHRVPGSLEDDSFVGALAVLARGAAVRFTGTTGILAVDGTTRNRLMGSSIYCIDTKDIPRFRFYSVDYDPGSRSLTGLVGGKPPCW